MKPFWAAIRFLTISPLPASWQSAEEDLPKSVPYFPLVGLLLGILAAVLGWGLTCIAPLSVTAALLIVLLLIFSGGLHVDGLADTADGVFSSRPREEMLRIMKDSRIGAMGVTAVVCLLLLKFAALSSLPKPFFWQAALLMPLAGRCALVFHLAWLPYARPQGLASAFFKTKPIRAAVGAGLLLLLMCIFLLGIITGICLAGLCLTAAWLLAKYFSHRLGGATGDTLGAACEMLELMPALFLAVWTFSGTR